MIAVDTSVVVAAFATWHEAREEAIGVIAQRPDLPAPCALETYAVLTRLPPPHRAGAEIVREFLERSFTGTHLILPAELCQRLVGRLVDLGISGGAAYDAVIAMIAVHHERALVTIDRRARPI